MNSGSSLLSDFLIIDEIQDISTDGCLDVFDLMVADRVKEGWLLLFGDFERQAIFTNETGRDQLRSRAPYLPAYKLTQNCRNLVLIGYQVNLFRRQDDGIDPTYCQFQAGQDQSALLTAAIRGLKDDGYELRAIVVLSPLRDASTAATTSDSWLRQILKPADGLATRPGQMHYCTIHAFKGLEALAVVLTDLDKNMTTDNFDSLLYGGLTPPPIAITLIEASTLRHAVGGTK